MTTEKQERKRLLHALLSVHTLLSNPSDVEIAAAREIVRRAIVDYK